MDWIISLFTNNDSVAHIALLYAIVIAVGVLLGKIKVGGVSLGVTFVLFAGIVAGHVGFTGPTNILTLVLSSLSSVLVYRLDQDFLRVSGEEV